MALPEGLQRLTFGRAVNQSSEKVALPRDLQSLTCGVSLNQCLEKVAPPSGLQSLTFDASFNQRPAADHLPCDPAAEQDPAGFQEDPGEEVPGVVRRVCQAACRA